MLDMGEPVRIDDVARRLIAQSGRDIDIVYTGLRPGEKLHEDLFGAGRARRPPGAPADLPRPRPAARPGRRARPSTPGSPPPPSPPSCRTCARAAMSPVRPPSAVRRSPPEPGHGPGRVAPAPRPHATPGAWPAHEQDPPRPPHAPRRRGLSLAHARSCGAAVKRTVDLVGPTIGLVAGPAGPAGGGPPGAPTAGRPGAVPPGSPGPPRPVVQAGEVPDHDRRARRRRPAPARRASASPGSVGILRASASTSCPSCGTCSAAT